MSKVKLSILRFTESGLRFPVMSWLPTPSRALATPGESGMNLAAGVSVEPDVDAHGNPLANFSAGRGIWCDGFHIPAMNLRNTAGRRPAPSEGRKGAKRP